MKVYLVMFKSWLYLGSDYDEEVIANDILGIYDSLEKAKKKLSSERSIILERNHGANERNFYDYIHACCIEYGKDEREHINELLGDLQNDISLYELMSDEYHDVALYIKGITYLLCVIEKEVE